MNQLDFTDTCHFNGESIIAALCQLGKPTLFLGNGFSINCRPTNFGWDSIAKLVELSPNLKHLDFKALSSAATAASLESVIKLLRTGSIALRGYAKHGAIQQEMEQDASTLRYEIVNTIMNQHPKSRRDIGASSYDRVHAFLSCYNTIYTVSYDLLLYWAFLESNDRSKTQTGNILWSDGFSSYEARKLGPRPTNSAVHKWKAYPSQNIYYLHGALHVFPDNNLEKHNIGNVYKLRSEQPSQDGSSKRRLLIELVKEVVKDGFYPVFVCDGDPESKKSMIDKCHYLQGCMENLSLVTLPIVTYGFSFGESDSHIVDALLASGCTQLYIGLYIDNVKDNSYKDEKRRITKLLKTRMANIDTAISDKQIVFYNQKGITVW